MRRILAAITRALKIMCAGLSQLIYVPMRMADGTIQWIKKLISPVATTASEPVDQTLLSEATEEAKIDRADVDIEGYEEVGAVVRRAAMERISTGDVRSLDIPVSVRDWIRAIPIDEVRVIAKADDLAVGLHMEGTEILKDRLGLPISWPDEAKDRKRLTDRDEANRRREEAYRQALPTPAPKRAPSLVPVPF